MLKFYHSEFRSIHNVCIEQLWVDVTVQTGTGWAETFILLKVCHSLNINNVNHIWLLHYLLEHINHELEFFAESWNLHHIQMCHSPDHSPADMFSFDMFVHGVQGYGRPVPEDDVPMNNEELKLFDVDWEGLWDDNFLQARDANNAASEGADTWLGRNPPPERLS